MGKKTPEKIVAFQARRENKDKEAPVKKHLLSENQQNVDVLGSTLHF